tara:strand:- start:495 stop:977 length:483 start_codon:yes stop_codon:yes gene_type:complete
MIYSEIKNMLPFFYGIRLFDSYFIIDMNIPESWRYSEMYGESVATKANGMNKDGTLSISLFSTFSEVSVKTVISTAKLIIKDNKEREEKGKLLEVKRVELETLFENASLEDLKRMNFITNKSNNKPTLNDEEKSKISGLVIQGTGQRHEQHTEKQTTVDK